MLSPLDLFKSYFSFKSYFTWFLLASILFGGFLFIKRKNYHTNNNTWKGYLIYFLIIMSILGFGYLCFFYKPQEPSSKYYGQLIGEIDKAIDKYDQTINDYKGLKSDWEGELKKCEEELKTLYEKQEINQEQKDKIKKLLDQTELKITDIKTQKQETENNINILKEQLKAKEQEKAEKDKEIAKKQEEEKLASPDDKIRLKAEIEKLQDERLKIVREIGNIEVKIRNLEADQEMYEDMLTGAENYKKILEDRFKFFTAGEKALFNQIKSAEERKAEIQKNIDEIDVKMITIGAERKQLEILRQAADASKTALDDWDKKHEFSFGNLRDALFQGAELYMDAFGGRGFLKAIGGGLTKEVAGTIAKAGIAIHEIHRVINLGKELFFNEDNTPKMMSKETYDSICARIERDKAKLDADYKDYERKKEEYRNRDLIKEIKTQTNQLVEFEKQDQSVINEYKKITNELIRKRSQVLNTNELYDTHSVLNGKLEDKNVEIETLKEQLKLKNPNYALAQQRLKEKQKQHAKFFQPITNK
ncbi:DNA double-strand break repair protein Rad50 [Candidatus Phytoplasma solani]|uniref:DNA double-strand break repair protein Rad50 n=1 Tax=Candidatus Phytoplasma solani TaxID=69896 RepID=UPI00358E537A